MSAMHFVVRDAVGNVQHGTVIQGENSNTIHVPQSSEISLDARRLDVAGYIRSGNDLILMMTDGRKVILEGYYGPDGNPQSQLYLNEGGHLIATDVSATGSVSHTEANTWGKFTDLDALSYPDDPVVVANAYEAEIEGAVAQAAVGQEEVTMGPALAALPLIGGLGGSAAPVVAGAGILGAGALVLGSGKGGRGGNDGGSGGTDGNSGNAIIPSIDNHSDNYVYNGVSTQTVTITGDAAPGSTVQVTIGGKTVTTTSNTQGRWTADFAGDSFPGDGDYQVSVSVTDPDGHATRLSGQTLLIDTIAPDVDPQGYVGVAGPVVNGGEYDAGFSLTGTGEPGASITMSVNGLTRTTTVTQAGTWSFDFQPGDLPVGAYDIDVTLVSTDARGNSTTVVHTIQVDTVAPDVAIGPGAQAGDNIVNAAEAAAGVDITGRAETGATVVVTMNGVSHTTTATQAGTWTVSFAPGDLPAGEYQATITAVATDRAGNATTTTSVIDVDTEGAVTINPGTGAGGEIVVNGQGITGNVTLTGTTEPGSTVVVTLNNTDYTATVNGGGMWSVAVPGGDLGRGEFETDVTVTSTDAAGNTSSTTGTVVVDTLTTATISATGGADNVINGSEAQGGVTFTGTGEPGAHVDVSFKGTTHSGTVDANGNWSVDFIAAEVPGGEYTGPLTVTSTDRYGNATTVSETVTVDTTTSLTATLSGSGADNVINQAEAQVGITLSGQAEPGSTVTATIGGVTRPATVAANGVYSVTFPNGSIPAGEYTATVAVNSTDAAGNMASAVSTVRVDTMVRDFAFTDAPFGGDGVASGRELASGLTFSGTVEPGSQVTLNLGGATRAATVAANGTWTASFPAGSIPTGEYDTILSVNARDTAGNTSTITEAVRVDTEAGHLALSSAAIEIDDIVNATERADGVTINGTATPGMIVTVTMGGASTTALAAANGSFSANFSAGQIPQGSYDAPISATITDSYGNTKTVTDSVRVDTLVENLTSDGVVDVDGVVNAAEAADGIVLTGTVEPGSAVSVMLGTFTRTATVDAAGNWSVGFAANQVPAGEHSLPVEVTATDAAGNTAMVTDTVKVDTEVNRLNLTGTPGGDGMINAAEAATGLTLTGVVEAGSSVTVNLAGNNQAATVDANGNWSVTFDPAAIGTGERDLDITVTATDAAGNSAVLTETVELDTVIDAAFVTAYNRSGNLLRGISLDTSDAAGEITTLSPAGVEGNIGYMTFDNPIVAGEVDFHFTQAPPDGSHLVITKQDVAGNETATLFAMDSGLPNTINMANPGFANHEIEAIDLRFAEDSQLTINSDILESLSGNSNALTIHGSADDHVTIDTGNGAVLTDTNQQVTIGSQSYSIYTLGDEGGTLIIDDDIQLTT